LTLNQWVQGSSP